LISSSSSSCFSARDADGNLIRPTVLAGVTPEMRVYGEESFGPVVTIVPRRRPDEAVRVANDTEYGLAAAVLGSDLDAALEEFTELRWMTVQQTSRHYPI
jgi:acyl-CoA reductase-like NAD-dependent aldehyde dehydrogenase